MSHLQRSPASATLRRRADAGHSAIADSLRLSAIHVDAIELSHQRCAALGVSRIERPDFSTVRSDDMHIARERTRRLLERATPVMEMLHDQIADSHGMVVLADSAGVIVHSIGDDDFLQRADKVALKPGADWSEGAKGTNAVGTALMQEVPTLVHAQEHYLHANQFLTCSAAPILDPRGNILGVLDVSGDHRGYHQHTMALVKMSTRVIENQWLTDDHRNVMRLHFHGKAHCIGTLMEGLLAVGVDGRIVGANRGALEQLGLSGAALRAHTLESLFGVPMGALVDRFRAPLTTPMPVRTPDGRGFHVLARFEWPVWSHGADPWATPEQQVQLQPVSAQVTVPPDAAQAATAAPVAPALLPASRRQTTPLDELRSGDPQMHALIDKVARVMDRGIALHLVGEGGTGKLHLARAIHASSARSDQPFVAVRCATINETLLEAQLLGFEDAGSATQPRSCKAGLIQQAHGGTLYLRDVGELPRGLQLQLLHILRERQLLPVGGCQPVAVNLHLICSSRHNLRELVDQGRFDEDLYYRLNGLSVQLPALRERSDLLSLARRILLRESAAPPPLSAAVCELLCAHAWPGNLRELVNVLRAALALAVNQHEITTDCLADEVLATSQTEPALQRMAGRRPHKTALPGRPARSLEAVEVELIRRSVAAADGNISAAAKELGISRNKVYRKLRWA